MNMKRNLTSRNSYKLKILLIGLISVVALAVVVWALSMPLQLESSQGAPADQISNTISTRDAGY